MSPKQVRPPLPTFPPAPHHDDAVRLPKWTLMFVLPLLGMLGVAARNEYRTNLNERRIESVETRVEREADTDRTMISRMERQVNELCLARVRDDRDSGKTPSVNCDRR